MRQPSIRRGPVATTTSTVSKPFAPAFGWFVLMGRFGIAAIIVVGVCRRVSSKACATPNSSAAETDPCSGAARAGHDHGALLSRKCTRKVLLSRPCKPRLGQTYNAQYGNQNKRGGYASTQLATRGSKASRTVAEKERAIDQRGIGGQSRGLLVCVPAQSEHRRPTTHPE